MKCPSSATLAAFTKGRHKPGTLADIATHIAACTACDTVVEALLAEERPLLDELPDGYEPLSAEECAVSLDAIKVELGMQHLTYRLMLAYYENELCDVSHQWVVKHLGTCDRCSDQVLDLLEFGIGCWETFLAKYGEELFGPLDQDEGVAVDTH